MKKKLNVIQINGIKGLLYVGFIVTCLAAGFVAFPSLVLYKLWNIAAAHFYQVPSIGILQGFLLWGILAVSYFTFRKERLVVCMKSADGLSEEELRSVLAKIKESAPFDSVATSMLKAHQAELKIKNLSDTNIPKAENLQEKNDSVETH